MATLAAAKYSYKSYQQVFQKTHGLKILAKFKIEITISNIPIIT
jgi:hypothetical protein